MRAPHKIARSIQFGLLLTVLILLPKAFSQDAVVVRGRAWEQADRLFRSDPLWLGGDAAFSTDLGGGRVLWMFGDSFVATKIGATRRQSAFIHNSIAIQTGYDPSQATITFYTPKRHGKLTELAPNEKSTWLWPLHGIRIDNRLLLFYMRMAPDRGKDSLGFQSVGWAAFLIDNPDAEPSKWRPRSLKGPEMQGKLLVGMSLIRDGEYLNALVLENVALDAYLLRRRVNDAADGQLNSAEWWCGTGQGWQHNSACRAVVVRQAGTEFSVSAILAAGVCGGKKQGFRRHCNYHAARRAIGRPLGPGTDHLSPARIGSTQGLCLWSQVAS